MIPSESYLYPPIINSNYITGFEVSLQLFAIYFNMSNYNDVSLIKSVHVSIRDQRTNRSLKTDAKGYALIYFNGNNKVSGYSDLYKVIVKRKSLNIGFEANVIYKVQLRFSMERGSRDLTKFSEWSEVALIKAIDNFTIKINNLSKDRSITLTSFLNTLTGRIDFDRSNNIESTEFLDKFRIKLKHNDEVIEDSDIISVSTTVTTTQFKYTLKTNLLTNIDYTILAWVQTSCGVEKISNFDFVIAEVYVPSFEAELLTEADSIGARVKLKLHIDKKELVDITSNKFIINRACSDTDYKIWEKVYDGEIADFTKDVDIVLFDYTVLPGKFYKYAFQKLTNLKNLYFAPTIAENSVIVYPEDMFLIANNKQLKIRFNPEVSNFSYVVSESKQETIGSKYPFIRRNANIRYRTFSLSGLITSLMDVRENTMKAMLETSMNTTTRDLYDNFKQANNITTPFKDYLGEKFFREKVMDFLYNSDVKLFKSSTLGAILVRLMNITLSPLNEIGRIVYSFSCVAYEIDEYNLENCRKYLIQRRTIKVGELPDYQYTIGQVRFPTYSLSKKDPSELNVLPEYYLYDSGLNYRNRNLFEHMRSLINNRYSSDLTLSDFTICYLKIEIDTELTPPYPILTDSLTNETILGYIVNIDNEPIIINKYGIYELIDLDVKVSTNINFNSHRLEDTYPKAADQLRTNDFPVKGFITFIARYKLEKVSVGILKSYHAKDIIGQYYGYYNGKRNILDDIKYSYYNEQWDGEGKSKILKKKTKVERILGLQIYGLPGTHIFTREAQDISIEDHVIGQSGLLEFYDENTDILHLTFSGGEIIPKEGEPDISINNGSDGKGYYFFQFSTVTSLKYPWYAYPQFYDYHIDKFIQYNNADFDYLYLNLARARVDMDAKNYNDGIKIGIFSLKGTIKQYKVLLQIRTNNDSTEQVIKRLVPTEMDLIDITADAAALKFTYIKVEDNDGRFYFWNAKNKIFELPFKGASPKHQRIYEITEPRENGTLIQKSYVYDANKYLFVDLDVIGAQLNIKPQENTLYKIKNYLKDSEGLPIDSYHYLLYYNDRFNSFVKLSDDKYQLDRNEFKGIINYYCRIVEREYE